MAIGEMSGMSAGAAMVCAGAAAWLMGGWNSGARRARLLVAGGGVVGAGPPPWEKALVGWRRLRGRLRAEAWSVVAGLVVALIGASVVPLFLGLAGVPLLRRVRRAAEARRELEQRGDAVIALCGALMRRGAGREAAGRGTAPGRA